MSFQRSTNSALLTNHNAQKQVSSFLSSPVHEFSEFDRRIFLWIILQALIRSISAIEALTEWTCNRWFLLNSGSSSSFHYRLSRHCPGRRKTKSATLTNKIHAMPRPTRISGPQIAQSHGRFGFVATTQTSANITTSSKQHMQPRIVAKGGDYQTESDDNRSKKHPTS